MGIRQTLAKRLDPRLYQNLEVRARAFDAAFAMRPYMFTARDLLRELDAQTLDSLTQMLQYEKITAYGQTSDEQTRLQDVLMARYYFDHDPLVHRMIALWTSFGFGQKVHIESADEKAQEVLDEFWEAERNRPILKDRELHKLSDIILTDGELFLTFAIAKADGTCTVRPLRTDQIQELLTDPADTYVPLAYKRTWTDALLKQHSWIYRDWLADDKEIKALDPASVEGFTWAADENKATDVWVLHASINTLENRGRSMPGRGLAGADVYGDFLKARAAVAQSKAMYVRELKSKAGSRGIDYLRNALASTFQTTTGATSEKNPPAAPGSTFLTNEAEELRDISMATGASDAAMDGMILLSWVGLAMGIPPHYLGRPDAMQNRATARELTLPVLRQWSEYQLFWKSVWSDVADLVLKAKEQYGHEKFEDHAVEVTMDSPLEVEFGAVIQGLGTLATAQAITPKVMATIALKLPEFGLADSQAVVDELFPEEGEQAPTPAPEVPAPAAPEQTPPAKEVPPEKAPEEQPPLKAEQREMALSLMADLLEEAELPAAREALGRMKVIVEEKG